MNSGKINTRAKEIETEIIFNRIEQLHNVTLNFSSQCFEIKKLCIITLTALITIFQKFSNAESDNFVLNLDVVEIGIAVVVAFHILDSMTYYYQRKMRFLMQSEENKLLNIQNIESQSCCILCNKFTKSIFNTSQIVYFILYLIFAIFILAR